MGRMYTWGSPEGVQAVINEMSEESPYQMSLNGRDMEALIRALAWISSDDRYCEGDGSDDDDHSVDLDGYRSCSDECWRRRAESLLGTIADSVGVEWV